MIKKINHNNIIFNLKKNTKRKHAKTIGISLFTVSFLTLASIVLSGCLSENSTQTADVTLSDMTHAEALELPIGHKSTITFSLQNIGNAPAKNVTIRVIVYGTDGNEQYFNNESVISVLDPDAIIPHKIILFNLVDDEPLNLNLTIWWDTGEHTYTRLYVPQTIKYADVQLDYFTHHERSEYPDVYFSHVNFTFRNTGNIVADNVKANIIVYDEDHTELSTREYAVSAELMPGGYATLPINISYGGDDNLLTLNITILWDTGENNYTRSFSPEFIEQADVQLENISHFERYRMLVGHVSYVDFLLQNKGNAIAKDLTIEVVARDQKGNIQYSNGAHALGVLLPGVIFPYELPISYDIEDTRLDLNITVKWTGGENQYMYSLTPKLI